MRNTYLSSIFLQIVNYMWMCDIDGFIKNQNVLYAIVRGIFISFNYRTGNRPMHIKVSDGINPADHNWRRNPDDIQSAVIALTALLRTIFFEYLQSPLSKFCLFTYSLAFVDGQHVFKPSGTVQKEAWCWANTCDNQLANNPRQNLATFEVIFVISHSYA